MHRRLVMAAGMIGNILNIILDYIFVMIWDMGIFGAGLATAIGFGTSAALLCLHFLCRKNTVYFTRNFKDLSLAGRMLKNGVGASALELSVGISIFMINLSLIEYSGSTGVAILLAFVRGIALVFVLLLFLPDEVIGKTYVSFGFS